MPTDGKRSTDVPERVAYTAHTLAAGTGDSVPAAPRSSVVTESHASNALPAPRTIRHCGASAQGLHMQLHFQIAPQRAGFVVPGLQWVPMPGAGRWLSRLSNPGVGRWKGRNRHERGLSTAAKHDRSILCTQCSNIHHLGVTGSLTSIILSLAISPQPRVSGVAPLGSRRLTQL